MNESIKPTYRVPSMKEIHALPWNGLNVISTFSGAGGSCLGYRLAGFRVLWANEFIPAAQETYRANHPETILDTRDIREVTAEDVLSALKLSVGDIDLMDGSPPCAAFSTAGKREKGWGTEKHYSTSGTIQRVDDLFFEFTRLLRGLQPKTFVAENVSGLVKGTAKGYFRLILQELRACGYKVEARLLDAQWLGVPQQRQRIIFIGVRDDLGLAPAYPKPLSYNYSVRDALPWILAVKHGGKPNNWISADCPCATVVQSGANRKQTAYFSGGTWVEAQTDITGLAIGDEWENVVPGTRSQKYPNLQRSHIDKPCPTVTAVGGNTSTAAVTHPTERRKFSIAELKRICSFPDDYELTGTFRQQWERLGRSVPPVMMQHIAAAVRDEILGKIKIVAG